MSFEHNPITTTTSNNEGHSPSWPTALDNAEAMVICTSAVPQISKLSLFKAILKIPLNILDPEKKKAINFRDLQFKYKENQYPEVVDYVGQKKQIDFAKKLGVKHVVCVSSCIFLARLYLVEILFNFSAFVLMCSLRVARSTGISKFHGCPRS